jgi:hypothetical protein
VARGQRHLHWWGMCSLAAGAQRRPAIEFARCLRGMPGRGALAVALLISRSCDAGEHFRSASVQVAFRRLACSRVCRVWLSIFSVPVGVCSCAASSPLPCSMSACVAGSALVAEYASRFPVQFTLLHLTSLTHSVTQSPNLSFSSQNLSKPQKRQV